MTIQFPNTKILTLVSDASTPPNLVQFAGIRIIWPDGITQPTIGVPNTLVIQGQELPGYLRTAGDGSYEWVLTGGIDPIVQALNGIPGADGWASPSARDIYANIGGQLLGKGVTLNDVRTALTQLYNGAVSNYVAAHPAA